MMDSYQAFAAKLGLTCLSAITAESVTYPVDFVKTRLQLQGELQANSKGYGALQTGLQILKHEGLKGLYAGWTPAVVRHIFYTGTRITVYERLKALGQQDGHQPAAGFMAKLAMGLTSGAVGQAVAIPADLVKVRMQADGRLVAAGKQAAPRYKGFVDALYKIVQQEGGVSALFRGASPAIQRAALVNLGELATYDQAKQTVLSTGLVGDNVACHTLSSVCSGFFASLISTPADVIKTRMMNQDPAKPLYRSSADCLMQALRTEGVLALYKGFFPTWARLGPWQLVFWTSYEHFRKLANMGSF